MFTIFCCGSISFILNGLIVHRLKSLPTAGAKRLTVALVFCHIFSVVSMAILIMRLIFLAVSIFVFRNSANILDSALTNLFLSLLPAKSSSCTESDN